MPWRLWRLLILDRRLAVFFGLFGGGFAVLAVLSIADPDSKVERGIDVFALVGGLAFVLAPLVWVGRERVFWLLWPVRRIRYRDVAYFETREGDWPVAVLPGGRTRRAIPPGGTFFDRAVTVERREKFLLSVLEAARVEAGGDPDPPRVRNHRTPLGWG